MGANGSIYGTSTLSTNASFSSFADASSKTKQELQFGSKSRRFNAKLELKEYFNRDPGPGAYNNIKSIDEMLAAESTSKKGFGNGFTS